MLEKLEYYFQQIWYEDKKPPFLLTPLEKLYRRIVTKKRLRFLRTPSIAYTPKSPVIVVGNITVGGTGKTPLTLFLIEAFTAKGLSVGVVSRGYGGKSEHYPLAVNKHSLASEVGDDIHAGMTRPPPRHIRDKYDPP